jgi:uncharacterized membrane protein YuzA (DUF378 family)
MRGLSFIDWLALILMVVGGLNWGIYGASNFSVNVIASIFGAASMITRMSYILFGLATLYTIAVAHSFRRAPSPEEMTMLRAPQTPSGPLACPPCP